MPHARRLPARPILPLDFPGEHPDNASCTPRQRALRRVEIDTNDWKSFVHERLATAMADPGCLSMFGCKIVQHRLFADHLTGEYRVWTEGRGRTVNEWRLAAHRPDNHWLDCIVGCAAAMQGVERVGAAVRMKRHKRRIRLSALQRKTHP